jgi:hypothetical protein
MTMKRIIIAAALAAAFWGYRRWLAREAAQSTPHPTESWENEGGALAPNLAGFETSQVSR